MSTTPINGQAPAQVNGTVAYAQFPPQPPPQIPQNNSYHEAQTNIAAAPQQLQRSTQPSIAIQSSADRLLQLFQGEKDKLTRIYESNLQRLEADYKEYKSKTEEEIRGSEEREKFMIAEITRLGNELQKTKRDAEEMKKAVEAAGLAFIDGVVRPK